MKRPLTLSKIKNFSLFSVSDVVFSIHREKESNVQDIPDEYRSENDRYIYNIMVTVFREPQNDEEAETEIALVFHLNMSSLEPEELICRAVETISELCGFETIRDTVLMFDGEGNQLSRNPISVTEVLAKYDEMDELISDEEFMKNRVLH